jgi:hypothetical protein
MKNLKLWALAFIIGTAGVFATTIDLPDVPLKQVGSQVAELLTEPDFTIEEDMKVEVVFTFNTEGEIIVLKVDSKHKDVLNYVRETLNHKKIDTPGENDKVYTLPLTIHKK